MAAFAWSLPLFLLTVASVSRICQGACFHNDSTVIKVCQTGVKTGNSLFIDAEATIQSNELCQCTFRQTIGGNIELYTLTGSTVRGIAINFYSSDIHLYKVESLVDYPFNRHVDPNSPVTFNMTGHGVINACINIRSAVAASYITVVCEEKGELAPPPSTTTTEAPPTTPSRSPPQTTPSRSPPETTPSRSPPQTTPSRSPPQTTPSRSPPQTTPSRSPPQTTPSRSPPQTTPSRSPPQTTPSRSPPQTVPPTTTPATETTSQAPQPQGSTESQNKFPVPEVAGGVAAGILVIILLVICVTCCTSRRRSERKPDEESLKSKGRESPDMQENKDGRGYAFDNLLYHTSQRDLTGKSVTPTVSDADPQDYQATKGLEELYASVNKTITDSTDIM